MHWRYFFDPELGYFDDETLVTSVHLTPVELLCVRIFLFTYAFIVLLATVASGTPFYGYFTDWTLLGINMYLMTAILNSFLYVLKRDALAKMSQRPYFVRYLNWILYVIPATCCYIVSIVYWTLIFPGSNQTPFNLWLTSSQHAFNTVIMVLELCLGRVPLAYVHLLPFLIVAFLYLAITELFHHQTGIWAYGFLDTSKKYAWAYYVGVAVGFVVVFYIVTAVHKWRDARREKRGMGPVRVQFGSIDRNWALVFAKSH